ncbi:MAG: hypothetical protein ACKO5C_02140, partial [Ferruginibacter sp.]
KFDPSLRNQCPVLTGFFLFCIMHSYKITASFLLGLLFFAGCDVIPEYIRYYAGSPTINGYPIVKTEIFVNGDLQHELTTTRTSPPADCMDTAGVFAYRRIGELDLQNWTAKLYLSNDSVVLRSGQVKPRQVKGSKTGVICQYVNVLN